MIFRVALWSVAVGPLTGICLGALYSHSHFNQHTMEPTHQVVPFSHRHHALELGIDCRYCHTSVETSAYAGIPPTKTCMSCHSMVWTNSDLLAPVRDSWRTGKPLVWNRVNDLPEFVYFDHSIHIQRGVSCNVCHGPVQQMPLTWKSRSFTMLWCLQCHRNPEKYLAHYEPDAKPADQVFRLYWRIQAGDRLNPMERKLAQGDDLPNNGDAKAGGEYVRAYGIRTAELADCTVCHR